MRFVNSVYFKIVAALAVGFLLYLESFVNHNKDLDVFTAASRLVFEGKTCYEVWIKSGSSGLKYFYSPLFAVILFPLKDLPQAICNLLWLSLNLLVLYRIFKLLAFYLPLHDWPANRQKLFYILTFLAVTRSLYDCFSLGQMTFILVWAGLEAFKWIHNGEKLKGAALLALVINIKLIPIALLAYLFYVKEWKAVVYTLLFSVLYILLPAVFIGFSFNRQLHTEWLASITNTSAGSILDDYGRQSLSSFVPALLMDTPLQFGIKRNFISLDAAEVGLILNGLRLIMLAGLVWLFGKPFVKPDSAKKLFYHLSSICLITPLFFPHQGKYSFFYLLPAYAYCIYRMMELKEIPEQKTLLKKVMFPTLVSFVFLSLTTDGLIGRHLSDLCEYLNFITIGTLLLLLAMVSLKKFWNAENPNFTNQ